MVRAALSRVCTCFATFAARVRARLDEHAERETGKWGANMEYKRRYTNPDEAKRHRAPPAKKP